ncbi:hypothetical protein CcrRB23_gp512 [Caulobacter phage RB23]|nr:hypothetical protein CcrRB23_gp017 [Caulobacter phage RB23]UTU10374.1 hypothetical protein CcrRB23_gp512 [Caulobacter phage RB23]
MGAGISKTALNARVRRRLQNFAHANGGTYAKYQAQGVKDGLPWTKGVNVLRASNGETFGLDCIVIGQGEAARPYGFSDLDSAILAYRLDEAETGAAIFAGQRGDYKRLIGRRSPFIQTWGFDYCLALELDDGGFTLYRPNGTMLPFRGEAADSWARELWVLLPKVYRRHDERKPLYRSEAIAQAQALDLWASQFADEDWTTAGDDWRGKPDHYKGPRNLPHGDPL